LNEDNTSNSEKQEEKPPAKKAYITPTFRFEKVLEVSALACGKLHTNEGVCRFSRKAS
jgi:hypothetical protein